MKKLFGGHLFPESWNDLGPRFSELDAHPQLRIGFFLELDEARSNIVNSDATPFQIQDFMTKVAGALSYCAAMNITLGGHLNQANQAMDNLIAKKSGELSQTAKSDAALGRALGIDLEVIELKWGIKDLEIAIGYTENIFKTLQKDAENWRARFYGAQSDKKLTPGVNSPHEGESDGGVFGKDGLPPSFGGR